MRSKTLFPNGKVLATTSAMNSEGQIAPGDVIESYGDDCIQDKAPNDAAHGRPRCLHFGSLHDESNCVFVADQPRGSGCVKATSQPTPDYRFGANCRANGKLDLPDDFRIARYPCTI